MSPKKAVSLPPPPPEPEEDEEISEEESEEGVEEESDVEENGKLTPIQPSQVNKKLGVQKQIRQPPPAAQSSDSESEEGEEDGSGSEDEEEEEEPGSPPSPNVSDFTVKPISQTKRSSDTEKDDEKDSRNTKKAKTNEGEEKKEMGSVSTPGGVGRVWSEEDQVALLQGMIDYPSKNGADPYSDRDAFYAFIKRKLQANISKNQLYEKMRRLKIKYLANEKKAESGEDLVFSKPYESKVFDLSKKIWGNADGQKDGKIGGISGNVKESKEDDLARDDMSDDEGDFQSKYPCLSESFDVDGARFLPAHLLSSVKKNLYLMDGVKAREWEERWNKIRLQEAKLFLKRLDFVAEQTKLVINAVEKGGSGN